AGRLRLNKILSLRAGTAPGSVRRDRALEAHDARERTAPTHVDADVKAETDYDCAARGDFTRAQLPARFRPGRRGTGSRRFTESPRALTIRIQLPCGRVIVPCARYHRTGAAIA